MGKWLDDEGQWKRQVPYEVLEAFGQDELRRRCEAVDAFVAEHSATTDPERGILNLTDDDGEPRKLYLHQVVAANHLLGKDQEHGWDSRNASLLANHVVGAGKTVTALLAVAGVHRLTPYPEYNKTFVIVPKAVLEVWYEHFQAWTTLGARVLKVAKQKEVTLEDVRGAAVILTTPDVLLAAYKTFHYKSKKPEDKADPYKRKEGVPDHPLFDVLDPGAEGMIGLAIIDELHRVAKPTNIGAKVVRMFTTKARYKFGLTGTPVSRSPTQVAHLAWALNALTPDGKKWLQKPESFQPGKGSGQTIMEGRHAKFNEYLVDRVDKAFLKLPEKTEVTLYFDPFVGLRADGTVHEPAILAHNKLLKAAKKKIVEAELQKQRQAAGAKAGASAAAPAPADDDGDDDAPEAEQDEELPEAPTGKKWDKVQTVVFAAMVGMGNFEFHSELGMKGATALSEDKHGRILANAVAEPSQAMRLIARVIRDRQAAGHHRIAVFCQSVAQLKILFVYLYATDMGEVFLYDSSLSAKQRNEMVKAFLKCDKGVLLFSGAGGIGITLCPGCEVLLSIGSLPWNATDIDQAFGRVYRIGQDQPVEIIKVVARRSISAAKLKLHDDKRDRLQRAVEDEDYSHFADEDRTWRWSANMLKSCELLDRVGNYQVLPEQLDALRAHIERLKVDRAHVADPNDPASVLPPALADDARLPPVTYPLHLMADEVMEPATPTGALVARV
jgi:SNF2 family DNA or RNA helicase